MPIHSSGGRIDGSDPSFQAAAQTALIKSPRITYPTASLVGADRSPFVSIIPEVGTIFAVAHRHESQLLMQANVDVIMDHVDASSNGGISANITTGVITLPAGHVFMLEASFYTTTWSNSVGGWARYAFVDAVTNLPLSGVAAWHAVVMPVTATHTESSASNAGVLLETTQDVQVKLRVTDAAGTHTMRSDSSSLRIIKIGSDSIGYVRSQLRTLITNADTGAVVVDSTVVASKNYVRYSADLTDAAWTKGVNHTATANANGAGYSRLATSTIGVEQDTYQTLQDSYTALMLGTESTASCEFIPESLFASIRLRLGSDTDAIYADLVPETSGVITGIVGTGVLNANQYTLETLAPWHFRLTIRGTPKPGDTTTPARLTITPVGSVSNAAVLIGNPSVTPGIVAPAHVKTTGRIINNAAAPRVISGHTAALDYLTSYDIQVQDIAVSGAKTALSSKIRFRTGLKAAIALSGVTGSNNWVEMLIGESAGSSGVAFHLRGIANTFPTAAGDGGSLLLLNRRGGAAQQFYVISVTGTTPNRVARVAVIVDDAPSLYIDDTAGSNQATAIAASLATGGTITQIDDNYIHKFTAGGTFTPAFAGNVRAVVVGGGAAGGPGGIGGGGGAGRFRTSTALAVAAQGYTVTVGNGGAATANNDNATGNNGSSSSLGSLLVSEGGSGGGSWNVVGAVSIGGSSGGGSASSTTNMSAGTMAGGATIAGERNPGGVGVTLATNSTGGGGGGAGGAGGAGGIISTSGQGGLGISDDITGTTLYYAAGGGAARYHSDITLGAPTGGSSIGGNGQAGAGTPPTAGAANTGSGGGGKVGTVGTNSGAGGSGVVIVAYPLWSGKTRHTAAVTGVS